MSLRRRPEAVATPACPASPAASLDEAAARARVLSAAYDAELQAYKGGNGPTEPRAEKAIPHAWKLLPPRPAINTPMTRVDFRHEVADVGVAKTSKQDEKDANQRSERNATQSEISKGKSRDKAGKGLGKIPSPTDLAARKRALAAYTADYRNLVAHVLLMELATRISDKEQKSLVVDAQKKITSPLVEKHSIEDLRVIVQQRPYFWNYGDVATLVEEKTNRLLNDSTPFLKALNRYPEAQYAENKAYVENKLEALAMGVADALLYSMYNKMY